MCKRLVGIRHSMSFIFLSHCSAFVFRRINQLAPETYRHGLIVSLPGSTNNPSHPKSRTTVITHFNRHLIGGTAHSSAANLNNRGCITQCRPENFYWLFTGLFLNHLKSLIQNFSGDTFLTVPHQII